MSKCIDPALGALLARYELHLLSDEETEQFELHLLNCSGCAATIKQSQQAFELLRSDMKMRQVVRELSVEKRSLFIRLRDAWWPSLPFYLKPAVVAASVVAMAVALAFRPKLIDQGQSLTPEGSQVDSFPAKIPSHEPVVNATASATSVTLVEIRSLRAGANTTTVRRGEGALLTFASELPLEQPGAGILLTGPTGDTLFQKADFPFDSLGRGNIYLPPQAVQSGHYLLVISIPNAIDDLPEELSFDLEIR